LPPFQSDFAATAASYSMKGLVSDGMDVLDVRTVIEEAVAEARKGNPVFVEA
jgi:Pyruvate/2-oxoglutarate dehydrogenase complex, dehydrogenase (E1) component, eukaryotic type, alpha subunit